MAKKDKRKVLKRPSPDISRSYTRARLAPSSGGHAIPRLTQQPELYPYPKEYRTVETQTDKIKTKERSAQTSADIARSIERSKNKIIPRPYTPVEEMFFIDYDPTGVATQTYFGHSKGIQTDEKPPVIRNLGMADFFRARQSQSLGMADFFRAAPSAATAATPAEELFSRETGISTQTE